MNPKFKRRLDAVDGVLEDRKRLASLERQRNYLLKNPRALVSLLGMHPDEWQTDLMGRLAGDAEPPIKRAVIACGRQVGKSAILSVYGAYAAMCQAKTVAVSAPSFRQSLELAQKIRRIIQRVNTVAVVKDAVIDLRLANGGRVVALPPSGTGRGFTLDALLVDEAAFLTDRSDLIEALTPALALADGQLILASSPGQPRGLLYQAWQSESWYRVKVRCDQCARISPEFLTQQRILLGEEAYRREFEAEFVDGNDVFLSEFDVDGCSSQLATEWLEI